MSKRGLLEKLTNKTYRDAFISEEIDVGLPMQLRAMRELSNWKQSYVADKTGTKQPRITLMERPGYGNFSLNTLKKMASLFDVALVVSFVPWGEMIDFTEAISNKRLAIPCFADDYVALERRYSRAIRTVSNTLQATLDFKPSSHAISPRQTGSTLASVTLTKQIGDENVTRKIYETNVWTGGANNYVGADTSARSYAASL
jgi:hypothetical protein